MFVDAPRTDLAVATLIESHSPTYAKTHKRAHIMFTSDAHVSVQQGSL